jgi:membrane protein DedA with SNARE-associated domain
MVPWLPADSSLPVLLGALFVVAFARAGGTYALARLSRHVVRHRGWSGGARVVRAERLVGRYGAGAVTLCFLTVGVQTAVHATAGSLRMPLSRYLPALVAGAVLWAALYAALGLTLLRTMAGDVTVVLLVLAGVVGAAILTRRHGSRG